MFGEQVKLTLDLEIKEPEDVFFNKIVDIAVDSQNSIYILDFEEKFLYQFSEEGQFVKKIGHPGKGPGEFEMPCSVFIDAKDNIYILGFLNRRVEVFNNNGDFIKSIKFNRFPMMPGKNSIIVDKQGNFYLPGYYLDKKVALCKYSPIGEFLKAIPLPIMEYNGIELTKKDAIFVNAYLGGGSLCLDEKDRIYFSYNWPYKICIVDRGENILSDISGTSNLNWIPIILRTKPRGILYGDSTSSQKIFWLNNEIFINSIKCVNWEGNLKVKIPVNAIKNYTGLDKYFKIKRKFAVLDIFNKNGLFIASAEINDEIIFLNADNKNRILGVKDDGENIPTIVRYNVEIIKATGSQNHQSSSTRIP